MIKLYKNKSGYSTKDNFELELQYAKKTGFDVSLDSIRIASKKKSNPNSAPWGLVDNTKTDWVTITPSFLGIEQKIKDAIFVKHNYAKKKSRTLGRLLCDHTRKKYCKKEFKNIEIIAINQDSKTQTIYIDIDVENGLQIAINIKNKLDLEEIVSEINYKNGRAHVIFSTDRIYSNEELKYIRDMLREEFNEHIDVRLTTTVMRYIDSVDYTTGLIKNNQFVPFNSPEERLRFGLNFQTDKVFTIQKLYSIAKKEYIEQSYTPQEFFPPDNFSMIEGRLNLETNRISHKTTFDESFLDKWVYGRRTRNEFSTKIISNCLRMGFTDTEEICRIVISKHDGTSEDINRMGEESYIQKKLIPMIEDFKANYNEDLLYKKPTKKDVVDFISNIHLLDLENNRKLHRYIKSIILEHKPKIKKIYTKQKRYDEAIRTLPLVLMEILGYAIYSDKNPRVKNNQLRISDYKFEQLMYGFQISDDYLKKLRKHYKISGINIRNVFDLVMKELFIQIKSNKRGWSFSDSNLIPKSCKQYIIKAPIFYNNDNFSDEIKSNLESCNKKPLQHNTTLLESSLVEYHNYNDVNNIYIHKVIYIYNKDIDFNYVNNNIEYNKVNILYKKLFSSTKERDVDDG